MTPGTWGLGGGLMGNCKFFAAILIFVASGASGSTRLANIREGLQTCR